MTTSEQPAASASASASQGPVVDEVHAGPASPPIRSMLDVDDQNRSPEKPSSTPAPVSAPPSAPTAAPAAYHAAPEPSASAPPMVKPLKMLRQSPAWIDCGHCSQMTQTKVTKTEKNEEPSGIIICLTCLVCFPLVPFLFCMSGSEEYFTHKCGSCNATVAVYGPDGIDVKVPKQQLQQMVPSRFAAAPAGGSAAAPEGRYAAGPAAHDAPPPAYEPGPSGGIAGDAAAR